MRAVELLDRDLELCLQVDFVVFLLWEEYLLLALLLCILLTRLLVHWTFLRHVVARWIELVKDL